MILLNSWSPLLLYYNIYYNLMYNGSRWLQPWCWRPDFDLTYSKNWCTKEDRINPLYFIYNLYFKEQLAMTWWQYKGPSLKWVFLLFLLKEYNTGLTLTTAAHVSAGFCIQIVTPKGNSAKQSCAGFPRKGNQHLPKREKLSKKDNSFFFFFFSPQNETITSQGVKPKLKL